MKRLHLSLASLSLLAVPAFGTVYYSINLAGPNRNTLVMKVDTRKMQNGGKIVPAPFTAVIRRSDGTSVLQYYQIPALLPGQIYQSKVLHGVPGARSASAANIQWGMDALGGSADSIGIAGEPTVTTDINASGPPQAIVAHCQHYSQIAIQQFQQAQNMQCGFSGNRWSANFQHHYGWCVGVLVPESNGETQARANAIIQCAH